MGTLPRAFRAPSNAKNHRLAQCECCAPSVVEYLKNKHLSIITFDSLTPSFLTPSFSAFS
jgi:hypothetical protein